MKQFEHTVRTPGGIHARTTGLLVSIANAHRSQVLIQRGTAKADLNRPIELLSMSVRQDETITIVVEGPDEEACCAALNAYMKESV